MRFMIEKDLGFVEIETNTDHGCIDGVWINGRNYADQSVAEMVLNLIGHEEWLKMIVRAQAEHDQPKKMIEPQFDDDTLFAPV